MPCRAARTPYPAFLFRGRSRLNSLIHNAGAPSDAISQMPRGSFARQSCPISRQPRKNLDHVPAYPPFSGNLPAVSGPLAPRFLPDAQCLLRAGRPIERLGPANFNPMHLRDLQDRRKKTSGRSAIRRLITSGPCSSQAACISPRKSSLSLLRDPSGRPGPPGNPFKRPVGPARGAFWLLLPLIRHVTRYSHSLMAI